MLAIGLGVRGVVLVHGGADGGEDGVHLLLLPAVQQLLPTQIAHILKHPLDGSLGGRRHQLPEGRVRVSVAAAVGRHELSGLGGVAGGRALVGGEGGLAVGVSNLLITLEAAGARKKLNAVATGGMLHGVLVVEAREDGCGFFGFLGGDDAVGGLVEGGFGGLAVVALDILLLQNPVSLSAFLDLRLLGDLVHTGDDNFG